MRPLHSITVTRCSGEPRALTKPDFSSGRRLHAGCLMAGSLMNNHLVKECKSSRLQKCLSEPIGFQGFILYYYMTWVCSRSNACSDWLILGHYSPVMPTGRLRACKSQAKSHIINNLLTSNVRSLRKNLKPRPCRIDLAIARSIRQSLGPRFSRKDLTLG